MSKLNKFELLSKQTQEAIDRMFSQFSINENSIERKVNHDGRVYYDFYVSMKGRENQGKFEYWPFESVPNSTKCRYENGYVEIWEDAWYLGDQIMLELADTYLTKWMKKHHEKVV
jgi:hypothetical protein